MDPSKSQKTTCRKAVHWAEVEIMSDEKEMNQISEKTEEQEMDDEDNNNHSYSYLSRSQVNLSASDNCSNQKIRPSSKTGDVEPVVARAAVIINEVEDSD